MKVASDFGGCSSCVDGYLFEVDANGVGSCTKKCDSNCETCSGRIDYCSSCGSGLFLSIDTYNPRCIPTNRDAIITGTILGFAFLVVTLIAIYQCVKGNKSG